MVVATLLSLASCTNPWRAGARFIPHNPLTFQQDSIKAAGLGVTLSKINEAMVIAHATNGGKVKIKNSFNTDNSQHKSNNTETEAKGEAIIGNNNAPVEAKKHAIVGDGNTKEESDSYWWVWLLAGLAVVVLWWYKKYG